MVNIFMYILKYFDNQIPKDLHEDVYNYIYSFNWQARYRNMPDPSIISSTRGFRNDLNPYTLKKTIYRCGFGKNLDTLKFHQPIFNLFNYINSNIFNDKFLLEGKPINHYQQYGFLESDDCSLDKDFLGHLAYLNAEPYEPVKRTRIPYRDWDNSPLNDERFFTIAFVANQIWNPVYHGEMFFYNDNDQHVGNFEHFIPNIPGRVILYDSRYLHNSKPTGTHSKELALRIKFRVKLKEGESLV